MDNSRGSSCVRDAAKWDKAFFFTFVSIAINTPKKVVLVVLISHKVLI